MKFYSLTTYWPIYVRTLEWVKLISLTGGFQILVQAISFVCGIFIIRMLPTQEYAYYTLANLMLGSLTILVDGGITTSVMALGGKVWKDRRKLGAVVVTGYEMRKHFAILVLVFAVPLFLYLFRYHGADWLTSVIILMALIPAFFTSLSGYVLMTGPALHQDIVPVQKIELGLGLGRGILLLFIFLFPFAYVAILAAGLPHVWGNMQLKKISANYADWQQKPQPSIKKEILGVVKRILPKSVFNSFSGQITIWLITIFGSTIAIAEIGALARVSMVLAIFISIIGTLVVPRYSRLASQRKILFQRFWQILSGLFLVCVGITGFVALFPTQLLWILGENYRGLEKELVLSIAGGCLNLMAVSLFTLATSRNWAFHPVWSISIIVFTMIAGIIFIDITTLTGVLKFNLLVASIEGIMYFIYCLYKIQGVHEISTTNHNIS